MKHVDEGLDDLITGFPDGLFRIDLQGKYVKVNNLYAEMFGYNVDEMLNGECDVWETWAIEEEIRLLLSEVLSRDIDGIVIKFNRKDGSIGHLELSIRARRDKSGVHVGYEGQIRDITQRYHAMNAEIEARRNAEFLVDLMTHDLNNIHQGLMMPLEYLLMDNEFPEKYRKPLELSLEQLHYATNLIKNVKGLQQVLEKSDQLFPVNLYKTLMEAAEASRRAFPSKNLKIDLGFEPDDYFVIADHLLVDLFFNLFHNAQKHDPGNIVFVIVEVHPAEDDRRIEVHVMDRGPGVPDTEKMRILQRRMGAKGSGIGLTIVNYLLDRYDGAIRVIDRVPGDVCKGSNFIVTLRLGDAE